MSAVSQFGGKIWIIFSDDLNFWGIIDTKVDLHVVWEAL